jgi:hypothetical protein
VHLKRSNITIDLGQETLQMKSLADPARILTSPSDHQIMNQIVVPARAGARHPCRYEQAFPHDDCPAWFFLARNAIRSSDEIKAISKELICAWRICSRLRPAAGAAISYS